MKVIDLFNKIANDEEVPIKIKFLNDIFKYDNGVDYVNSDNQYLFGQVIPVSKDGLNKEVDIIEDKKLEKIEMQGFSLFDVADKVNEIIDCLNAGDDKE